MFAIIDTETTGGRPAEDRIMEIAIIVHNGKRVVETYSTLVNPQRRIDPFVSAMTGITEDMVADAPKFEDIYHKVQELTEGKIFVAHNARFDYGMIRNEYKRLNRQFLRKQLCTVKVARHVFPGLPSYSLGRLCESIGIKLNNRHRAFGDAEATALLFEKLLLNDRKEVIRSELNAGLEDSILPNNLSRDQVDVLPEETGVYYFLNAKKKIIYIGKSTNIKKRVISHFSSDIKAKRFAEMKEEIHHVDFHLTGSELIAMLKESDEIKRFMPAYNLAQKIKKYRFGIFIRENELGLKHFSMESLKLDEDPLIKVTTPRMANMILEELEQKHHLKQMMPMIQKMVKLGTLEKFKEGHNEKVHEIASRFYFEHSNFFIVEEAINPDERSLVWVENNTYRGFGYAPVEEGVTDIAALANHIQPYRDNPDVRNILRTWLRKNKKARLLIYNKK
jgi:DNA polymerase-3 subunit epsilon